MLFLFCHDGILPHPAISRHSEQIQSRPTILRRVGGSQNMSRWNIRLNVREPYPRSRKPPARGCPSSRGRATRLLLAQHLIAQHLKIGRNAGQTTALCEDDPNHDPTGENAGECGAVALACADCGDSAGCTEHAQLCPHCGNAVCSHCADEHGCHLGTDAVRPNILEGNCRCHFQAQSSRSLRAIFL
jgi:hypothetical protein